MRRFIVSLIGVAILASLGGWCIGSLYQSRQEREYWRGYSVGQGAALDSLFINEYEGAEGVDE